MTGDIDALRRSWSIWTGQEVAGEGIAARIANRRIAGENVANALPAVLDELAQARCVAGHSAEIPERDLEPQSNYRIWLDTAKDHNPVAELLARLEGADVVDYDEPVGPAETRPTLAELQQRYLEVRQHTLSIDGLPFRDALADQAEYVADEARELLAAVQDDGCGQVTAVTGRLQPADELRVAVRHEIADVVLATVTLANLLGETVEACIDEKTEADRGRG